MMKKIFITFLFVVFTHTIYAKIAQYNHFPTLQPSHILDEELTDISFAFSMRVLVSDYDGSLIRLRRESDGVEKDFGWGDNDIVDIDAINTWRGISNVYVHTWYDQSGLGRDAVQTTQNRQPRFYSNTTRPYFQGDGNNDYLVIDTPNGIQDVTKSGVEGTIITIMTATQKSQHSFGVLTDSDRWSTHINWSNNNVYFDPGICCNNIRSFENGANVGVWNQYTFIRTNSKTIARQAGVEKFNGTYNNGRCSRTEDFTIGWANGNQVNHHATTLFLEMIMYKVDIHATNYTEIETNSMIFWGL
ncbi:MAG: Alpha-L-arabinofuranosidase B, catalytic [uncultured Sulfurovum sp.]|uniref:Alpha-L-arabinofuranosidase B, catalytic n=1 Tax=uncultured Sulfurovum sp. TaxID=269237 RepID=A0A6S6RZE6_9BACT|nr:MAG: Alpha-L-arabinofuranosidase B, catalytic [uncultured Sulfurovum sp.]